jgi:hypothetical protein
VATLNARIGFGVVIAEGVGFRAGTTLIMALVERRLLGSPFRRREKRYHFEI